MIREIIEKYIDTPRIAGSEWEMMARGNIPITPSLWKEFEIDKELYHITDFEGLVNLKKIEGQKKMIAGFNTGSKTLAYGDGRLTDGTILVKLKGKASFQSPHDLGTYLDRNGNRWIPWDQALGGYSDFLWDNFTEKMANKMNSYLGISKKDAPIIELSKKSGKEKQTFIKWYYDEAKKLITKSFIKKFLKELENTMDQWMPGDETLLHSFKILDVKIVVDSKELIDLVGANLDKNKLIKSNIKNSGIITRAEVTKLKIKN